MNHSVRSNRRRRQIIPRFLPVLSLCLIVHSFVTSATHHHLVAGSPVAGSAAANLPADPSFSSSDQAHSPASETDSECALCRLQRTPAAEVRPSTPIALPSRFVWSELSLTAAPARGVYLTPCGRAPPSS